MRRLVTRSRLWLTLLVSGGGLFLLEGCDPTVRDTVLGGVGTAATSLSSTFIQAFMQSLQSTDDTTTTVRAIIEEDPAYFA